MFQNINEALRHGVMVSDRQGRIILANPPLERMLGLEPIAMLGLDLGRAVLRRARRNRHLPRRHAGGGAESNLTP
ncbi:hypothetical protein DFAR_3680002 [Desulfarculales bacterium]